MTETPPSTCVRRRHSRWTTCRCPDCRLSAYRVRKLSKAGMLTRVPSDAAWEQLEQWHRRRWSGAAVASAANLSPSTSRDFLTTIRDGGRRRVIGPAMAQAIINARRPTIGKVGAHGAIRRIQALAVMGWGAPELAEQSELGVARLYQLKAGTGLLVTVHAHYAICGLYDRLSNRRGPAAVVAANARAAGLAPPMAWDDDEHLDDPDMSPCPWRDITTRGNVRKPGVFVEDVEWLVAAGEGIEGAARRLGVQRHSLVDMLKRAGRTDLTERLKFAQEAEAS